MNRLFVYCIFVSMIFVLLSCRFRSTSDLNENSPPEVTDILINPVKPQVNDSVMFNAVVVDPDGDLLTVNWKVSDGKLENDGRGNPIKFTPPNDSGYVSLSCIANDGRTTGSLTKSLFIMMEPAELTGFIADARSHNMIENAHASLGNNTTRTKPNGYFRFQDLPVTGPRLLSITKEGYKHFTETVSLSPGMNTKNVVLEKIPGTVFGIIRDAGSNNLLEGVRVALRDMEDSTSFSGYFAFRDVPVGTHTIIAKKSGYYTLPRTIEVKPGENQVDLDM